MRSSFLQESTSGTVAVRFDRKRSARGALAAVMVLAVSPAFGQSVPAGGTGRDLPNRSNIGVLFVNRQATGDLAGTDDYNRTYALDGRWGIGQNGQVTGFMSRTETPGLDGDDHAYNVVGSYNSELWQLGLGYIEIADNFNPEVGFLRRSGFRNVDVGVAYTFRPKHFWKLQEMRPHGSFNRFWNFEGQMETSYLHFDYDFSPRLFAQALVQYNDSADLWSANLRFGLVRQANTGLFIVYNDTRGLHDTIPSGAGRSLVLKCSQLFDLID